jgi:hypothetical protein
MAADESPEDFEGDLEAFYEKYPPNMYRDADWWEKPPI